MNNIKKYLVPVLVVLLLVAVVMAIKYHNQASAVAKDPQVNPQKEITDLVAEVGKLMLLPDEIPTIATITDPNKLKEQAFFANSKVGDKVLIYAGARKAILYDPIAHKILEVSALSIGNPPVVSPAPAKATTVTTTPAKK